MTNAAQRPRTVADSARGRVERAESIKRAWQEGEHPDAAAALRANPDLAADRTVALDLAYEEYCAREEAGAAPDSEAFCAQFSFGASLRRLLTVHQFLDAHPDALSTAPPAWPAAGDPVGDFFVLRELGRGSFARVYLAVETTAGDRPVVLKVSAAGSREADTQGPLAHPNLAPVLSCRTIGAWTVVAMPFAGTATLEDAIEAVWAPDRPAPPRTAAPLLDATARGGRPDDPPFPGRPAPLLHDGMDYGDAVAAVAARLFSAVAELHERGITHRDIKPSNVLFGPGGHPYLLDFNLASCAADPWRLVGTLPYMAPEQLARFAAPHAPPTEAPDERPGDVFACGVLLFELLTGRHPFVARGAPIASQRESAAAALLAAQRAGHPPLAALNPRVRRAVRDAVSRCLALAPEARPAARELVALLAPRPSRRWRKLAWALVGTGALAPALGYGITRALVPPPPAAQVFTAQALPATPFERGLFYCQKKEYGLAAVEFQQATHAEPTGRAHGYLAFCLSHRDPKGALGSANTAIQLGYQTPPVYANRAYSKFKSGDSQGAINDCDEALRRDQSLLPARYTRAAAQLQLFFQSRGKKPRPSIPPEAIADIESVTAAGSDDPEVWVTAAQLYVLTANGRPETLDRAAQAVETAIRHGKAPEKMTVRNNTMLRPLADHPVYKRALAQPPVAQPSVASAHIANPID